MTTFLLSIIFIFITSYSYGIFFNKIFIRANNLYLFDLGETIILGYFFLLIISIFFHFFIPINYTFTILILVIALCYLFFNFYKIKISNIRKLTLILLILFAGFITSKNHPDFEWYHLPYLNYLKNYKIVFGIANLNDFLGYSQTWNDIIGVLRIPFIDYRVANFAPVIFCISIIYSLLYYANSTKLNSIKLFIYLIIIFMISKYYKFDEYGGHVPPIFLAFLINVYFFIFIIEDDKSKKNLLIFKILLFSLFLVILRVNYIFILPIILYLLIFNFKIIFSFLLDKKFLFLIIFLISIFLIKNIITSGCAYYPIDFTCFSSENLSWSVGKEYATERFNLVKALSRGWSSYVTISANISHRIDYFEHMENGLILNPAEYLNVYKNSWIKYWLYTGDAKKILNNILVIFFCFIILSFKGNLSKILNINTNLLKRFLIIFFVFVIQLIFCYLFTPQTIYGADVATIVFCSLVASFFLQNINLNNNSSKYLIVLLFFISISYFQYKNFFRIYEEIQSKKINFFSSWSVVSKNNLGNDYYKYSIKNYKINIKNKIPNRHIGLPDYCGNIPMFCVPEDRKICIKNIDIKKNYYFIEGNHKKCLKHLKSRYFY